MVLLRSLLLVATASLGAAHYIGIYGVPPDHGHEIVLKKTINDEDKGTFTLGGDVKFKVGFRLGGGSKGTVYSIDCDGNQACMDLGETVVKYYIKKNVASDEQHALAKIGELKAVGTQDGNEYTLMKRWQGVNLTKLPQYKVLKEKEQANKEKINTMVTSAAEMVIEIGRAYIQQHHIYHEDATEANSLFQADGEAITSAALIDWDASQFFPATDWDNEKKECFMKAMYNQVNGAFERFGVDLTLPRLVIDLDEL